MVTFDTTKLNPSKGGSTERILYFEKGVPEYIVWPNTVSEIRYRFEILFDTEEWDEREWEGVLDRFATTPLGWFFEVKGERFVRVKEEE